MATPGTQDMKMDPAALYREDIYTDRRMGTIRVMTPVTADGDPDASRDVVYVGEAQVLTPMGAIPLAFELEAKTLGEAVAKFSEAAQVAVERTARELRDMRREQASSIVVPGGGMGGMGGLGGGGLGGLGGGGGKIQMP
jgi:hypothetical protein